MSLFERKQDRDDLEHPSVEQLNAFILGHLGEDASAEIERHITTCKVCTGRIETPPTDALVSLFREAQSLVLPDEPLPPAEKYDFLAPAQGPDELGRLGSYRVLRVLGSGGMGIVFVAEDPDLERRVALKVMKSALACNPRARERFLREARSMAKLTHPRVVTIHHVGQERGVPFLAMELLDGESLEIRLKRQGQLPVAEALRIGREIAEGLAAAHQRGLIHRDIKPSNLWLEDKTGHVKILDFGLARSSDEQTPLTLLDAIVGTPAYMSPEQARGEPVDHRGDLFSLGCVLYQLVTGKLPFRGSDPMSVLAAVVTTTPPPVQECNPDVPSAFAEIITRLLSKRSEARYPHAQAVVEALQSVDAASRAASAWSGTARRTYGLLLLLLIGIVSSLGY
jgi:serine/threonine protein kinase